MTYTVCVWFGTMNAATAIQEQVRILAMDIGVRPAARKLGLNEDTVCSWAIRYGWEIKPAKRGPETIASKMQATTVGDAIRDELAENERETRLSLSRYAKRAAKDSENATLKDAPYVHKAAQVAGIAHRWGDNDKQSNQFTLNVLNINSLQIEDKPE